MAISFLGAAQDHLELARRSCPYRPIRAVAFVTRQKMGPERWVSGPRPLEEPTDSLRLLHFFRHGHMAWPILFAATLARGLRGR